MGISPRWIAQARQYRNSRAVTGRRRVVAGLSLVGIASMAATSLLQTGVIKHLPDPPLPGFDSDKVNLSRAAFPWGVPDGTLALLSFAVNLPLAAYGGVDRAQNRPWIPLAAGIKSVLDVAVSGWYLFQMPTREKAWCGYCLAAAVANVGILLATLPEARRAAQRLR